MIRSYAEFSQIEGFEERFAYLQTHSSVGIVTFGYERWLNQAFYTSSQWRRIRHHVIARDKGCDLGVEGHGIRWKPTIHHMNPMTVRDVTAADPAILDPEFLISVTPRTHNAIHYGDASLLEQPLVQRFSGDTKLW
jgi:hypothetical protein